LKNPRAALREQRKETDGPSKFFFCSFLPDCTQNDYQRIHN
jgi:hypothetical protein